MFIELKDVCKSYGTDAAVQRVLEKVELHIERGERCAILGPSGSGKSTLLNVIGGLDTVDTGLIQVGNLYITQLKPKELVEYRRKCLGFVFQFYNLVPNLTIRENIEVCKFLTSKPLDIEELMEVLGLLAHQNKYPAQVSGGQQQRCSLARALVKNPELLLCDEPTGALDSVTSGEMLELLEKVNETYNTTMLIVTHNDVIRQMCHRIVEIKDGKVVKNGLNPEIIPAVRLAL